MRHALIGLSLCAGFAACSAGETPLPIIETSQRSVQSAQFFVPDGPITEDRLIAMLRRADVVILGEVHDNPEHHAVQSRLVAALAPSGLAVEMIPAASEEGVAVFLEQGGLYGDIGPAIGWERLGWPDWRLYQPIFEAAKGAVITGGGLRRAQIRRAVSDGAVASAAASADPVLIRALNEELSATAQAEMEAEMIASHCGKLPSSTAPGMVEAQRLRDASFAAAALRARDNSDGLVVLITGTAHARSDRGVPLYIERLAPGLKVATVGFVEAVGDAASAAKDKAFDAVMVTLPASRDDPCAVFQ